MVLFSASLMGSKSPRHEIIQIIVINSFLFSLIISRLVYQVMVTCNSFNSFVKYP